MKKSVKRGIAIVVLVVVVLIAIPAGMIAAAFIGNRPLEARAYGTDAVIKDGFVAVGLIDEGNGSVALIDAGNDKSGKAIIEELSKRHLGPDAVSEIFLTHGHPDHTNGALLFPNATIYLGAADVALATGKEGSHGPLTRVFPPQDSGMKNLSPIAADGPIKAGNKSVQAFLIPGHTHGSLAYLVDGLLFVGDSAGCSNKGTIVAAPYAMSDSQDQNRASLKSLAARLSASHAEVKAIICAHSGALDGLQPLLDFKG